MMAQGLALLIVGMGMVFVFLALLVAVMNLTAAAFARLSPMPIAETGNGAVSEPPARDHADIAVVIAAVRHHSSR